MHTLLLWIIELLTHYHLVDKYVKYIMNEHSIEIKKCIYSLDNKTQEYDGFEVVAVFKWLTTQAPISTVPMFQLQKWQYFHKKNLTFSIALNEFLR